MNDITYLIVRCIVIILATIVSVYVIPYIKQKLTDAQYKDLLEIITIAVQAVEQTMEGGQVKKEEVVKFVSVYLMNHKIDITPEQLDKLIESAVYVLKQNQK